MSVSSTNAEPRFAYEPGDIIAGKYALESLLGSGGMGAVFRARNTVIDMPVAIKLIRADLDRATFSGRLLQEARAAAKLAHPAIVRVFDVGQTALGDPFIVMELLEGETLSSLIEREGRLTSERAVQLLLPIADALSAAHAKGFVHRDVKPDNVFVSSSAEGDVQPKLVDFGIVKHDQLGSDTQQTQAGSVVGSPDYMSPEQARGLENIDLRSDVWSFSVVIHEAITGRPPFDADNYNALLRKIVETEPMTLRELSAADEALSAIVSKGLSKDPESRWASLGQMGKALASWLYDQGITEDACGASLESRWLSRSADSAAGGRSARGSSPESWPNPPSGVRAVSHLGTASTLPASKSAGTPLSLAQTSAVPAARARGAKLGVALGLVAAALGAAALLTWRASSAPSSERSAVSAAPTAAAPSPTPSALTPPAPSAVAAASSPSPAPSAAPRVGPARSVPAKLAKPRPTAPRRAAPTNTRGASDLLSPY